MPSSKSLNSRERVLKAATALFAARGFHQTSTRDVARRARVNEITVFRLFKNKRELYLQVLDGSVQPIVRDWLYPILQSSDDAEQVFLSLAERLQDVMGTTFLRLFSYAALEQPELLRRHYHRYLSAFEEVLGRHIQSRIDADILRRLEPTLISHALVGIIAFDRIVGQFFSGGQLLGRHNAKQSAKAYTDIWLRGALASDAPARHSGRGERAPEVQPKTLTPAGSS
jgi:AcrR family transcriptional regulator